MSRRRFFRDYHPMLPILHAEVTPNSLYQHAPLLFWIVLSIGSRRHPRQPTLVGTLAGPVTELALQSIAVRTRPIERMKAIILLLTWPFPSGPFYHDPSFLLGGSLLHMAMQHGLHAPSFGQEFSKPYVNTTEQEPLRRAELWAYAVITYQRYILRLCIDRSR